MPNLIDNLPENEKIIANNIIERLASEDSAVAHFNQSLNTIKSRLDSVNTQESFSNIVVDEILPAQNEFFTFLNPILEQSTPRVLASVQEYFEKNNPNIHRLLKFHYILNENILKAKERLTLEEMRESLSEEKHETVIRFIEFVKSLAPISAQIKEQEKYWTETLEQSDSKETTELARKLIKREDEKLAAMVQFPEISLTEDPETANAIIQYFETNPRLLEILQSFNHYESLYDRILDAQSRLDAQSLNPSMR